VARPRGQVVSPSQRPGDPENIPHDDEERGAATTSNPETETQVSGHVRPELLVTDSARTTLSRWRHGFETRWDYERNPGQGSIVGIRGAKAERTGGDIPAGSWPTMQRIRNNCLQPCGGIRAGR
jgi:hypothetical protein